MTETTGTSMETGLSSLEARKRLEEYGPNVVPEERPHPFLNFVSKLWGPIPWMLELSILLQLFLGKSVDAVITFVLLLINALLSFIEESRAQNALALLRQSLTVQSRVLRDGRWQVIRAQDLVPGDVVHLRVGDMIPADLHLLDGQISADQSALTGESTPVEVSADGTAYAGSVVKRGEATGNVTATAQKTYFGKTAELVHTARTASHIETIIQSIVKYLVAMNVVLAAAILMYTFVQRLPLSDLLPFMLMLLVASIPVALPATFTLASALGSLELSKRGVLLTRLFAIQEAAAMDVLCSDKTGTITLNQLTLAASHAYAPCSQEDLLRFAALASDDATQDPIDLAILNGVKDQGIEVDRSQRLHFTPFDPTMKRTEAMVRVNGQEMRVVKGFPQAVSALTDGRVDPMSDVEAMAARGHRVLAVATSSGGQLQLSGLIGLHDPSRPDSASVIEKLHGLGVRVIMITGDSPATAKTIAQQVGIIGPVCPPETLRHGLSPDSAECAVFASAFPEDKFKLVRTLQQAGHVVGMTGDGVNDAPALKQAEVGVAVANATDVAKAAASLVLTNPGLNDMLAAVEVGRRIHQRMLTYTLNKIVKTFQIGLFLTLGLLLTGILVTRPHLILLLLFANDFVTMALATDHVSYSRRPDHWDIRTIVVSALTLAAGWLLFSFGVLLVGRQGLKLDVPSLQTLIFVMLVLTGQANVYLVRERHHFWRIRPSRWLALSTTADLIVVGTLATMGILMHPISPTIIIGLFVITAIYMIVLDSLKVAVFRHLGSSTVQIP